MGVRVMPTVGDLGSIIPSGVLSTTIGVLAIPTEGERGSNSWSTMRLCVPILGGVEKSSLWSLLPESPILLKFKDNTIMIFSINIFKGQKKKTSGKFSKVWHILINYKNFVLFICICRSSVALNHRGAINIIRLLVVWRKNYETSACALNALQNINKCGL